MSIQRREFLKSTAVVSAFTILKPSIVFGSKANSAIRIGIIGCGNRGTAVISSMVANTNANIVAMADLFQDKLLSAESKFNKFNSDKGFSAIPKANIYHGSKSYSQLLANKDVDAVLISSPAYTHPSFFEAAVNANKHVYCEKPASPDVEGCKKVQQAGEKAKGKISAVIGFQIRYATPYVEMIKRIQDGSIGDVVTVQLYYFSSGTPIHELKNVPDDEFRIRNHYHFEALSGGILLDQGIHMLDVCNWGLQAKPIQAIGRGGMKGGPGVGDTWNNYQVLYQYPNDINVSIHSTQFGPTFGDVCCKFIGTKGYAEAHYSGGVFINGDNKWDSGVARAGQQITPEQQASGAFLSSLDDADKNKERAFIESIEKGTFLNEIQPGVESTLTALLGREAAERKKEMTWDEIIASNQRLDPKLNLVQFDKA
jgi:myo-inositol 2-dehydrogenase / D-chiro-inositol 1-dehydrogenase